MCAIGILIPVAVQGLLGAVAVGLMHDDSRDAGQRAVFNVRPGHELYAWIVGDPA